MHSVISSLMQSIIRPVAVLAAIGALATTALAQGTTTTGAIRGRVADSASAALGTAQVVAVNEETAFSRSTVSDDDGTFVIRLLPPGSYRVSARRIGYQPLEQRGIRVVVGSTAAANFSLRTASAVLGTVEIVGQGTGIDVTQGGIKQTVSEEQIRSLPTLGRDFTDFINLSGLVSPQEDITTGGQFSIAGQRPSQTNVQIDGVDANNSFFGENRGGSRIPFNFSLESIREFQIITNGYDVEYGNYSGGVINIVTKGGTNTHKATVYGNFRNADLTRSDFAGRRPNNFEVQQYAGLVEGPIVRDKLFYLLSLDGQRRREPFRSATPALYRGDSTAAAASDSAPIRARAPGLGEAARGLERFYSILGSQYGVVEPENQYGEFKTSNDVLTLFGRLDWNASDKHRISLRHNYSDHDNLNESGTFAGGISRAEAFRNRTNSFVSELTSIFRSNVFNVLRVQLSDERRPRDANSKLPELRVNITPNDIATYGGSSIAFNNYLEEQKLQVINNLTVDLGDHTLKLGTNNVFAEIENRFWFNGSGFYTFANLDALEQFRPISYTRSVRADGSVPRAAFGAQEYSVYAQDDWQATPKLLASIGLRYDVSRYGDRPGRVIDVERAFGFETGTAPVDNNNVSPRLSFAYDVRGDASEVVRLGGALFYGRVPYVMGGNVAITDVPLLNLDCRGAAGEPNAPPSPTDYRDLARSGADNPFNCAGATGVGGVPTYTFWNDNFELPETWRANVGYERLFGDGYRVTADLLVSASTKLYTVRNLNLRPAQFQLDTEGSRAIFVPEGAFVPSTNATGPARLRNTDFGDLFVNYNDGQARSQAATMTVDRRFRQGSQVSASYTYTRAFDNSSYSCCTAFEGFQNPRVGANGPNLIGGAGDTDGAWGPSAFVRNHTIVVTGMARLPWDVDITGIWRTQSGTPWGPEVNGDINGDGIRFNDRPYIYAPEDLPVFVAASVTDPVRRDSTVAATRAAYAGILQEFECIGENVGGILPRNPCRQPWFNRLDLSVRKQVTMNRRRAAEISVDLFNVLNGLSSKWGRYESITTDRRNLLTPQAYDAATNTIQYTVPTTFGDRRAVGANLLLQFSAQLGARLFF